MFSTVVHSDDELTKIEKFQHLRSSLSGPALDSIRSLEICDENYEKAIEILKKRFDNKRLNFQAHIRDIVSIANVEARSVSKLRHLSDTVNSHLRALFSMGTKEQIADCLLINIISRKLDIETQRKWEEQTPVNKIPTWNSMDIFLQKRCQTMENVECAELNRPIEQVGSNMYTNPNMRKRSLVVTSNTINYLVCNSQSHSIFKCPHFQSQTPYQRFKEAKRLGLCLNCLKKGHNAKSCLSSGCRTCSAKHNSLLHMEPLQAPQVQMQNSRPQLNQTHNNEHGMIEPNVSTSVQNNSNIPTNSTFVQNTSASNQSVHTNRCPTTILSS
ncbi:uncharacterized protein LOC142228850 [Haematobia irritans]|uniref:uncharacterized protein LOC142228850 n=1 Tax=Haematobia irritans TaxID=7368 RepID=UPI003F4F9EFD